MLCGYFSENWRVWSKVTQYAQLPYIQVPMVNNFFLNFEYTLLYYCSQFYQHGNTRSNTLRNTYWSHVFQPSQSPSVILLLTHTIKPTLAKTKYIKCYIISTLHYQCLVLQFLFSFCKTLKSINIHTMCIIKSLVILTLQWLIMSLTVCSYNYSASTKFYLGVAFSENTI